jgi:NAD(P)-dependent dehydrogenase (short-subunit alcohol dehydrogenase family)
MNRLQNKRTPVTGRTTGIGLETARQFLREGARVATTGSSPEKVDKPVIVPAWREAGDLFTEQHRPGHMR